MASFTGPELGALVSEGCVIGAHEVFTEELERQMVGMSAISQASSSYAHWCGGCYLITSVTKAEARVELTIDSPDQLENMRARLGPELSFAMHGERLRLAAAGSFAGLEPMALRSRLEEEYSAPLEVVLERDPPPGCGDDHVCAVNLTRPLSSGSVRAQALAFSRCQAAEELAYEAACSKFEAAAKVTINHYLGGPCHPSRINCCVVPGGGGCGWTVLAREEDKDEDKDEGGGVLARALELAHLRAAPRGERQGAVCGGQTVRLCGLQARPELNGEIGLALRFPEGAGRWMVMLRNGEGKKLKPANLEPLEGEGGRVLCFWGAAQWSRTQLLGELARGHWGLCKASVAELISPPQERRAGLVGRLVYSPETDMTEDFMRQACNRM